MLGRPHCGGIEAEPRGEREPAPRSARTTVEPIETSRLVLVDVPASPPQPASPALRVAAALVVVEGLLLVAAGVLLLVRTVTGTPNDVGTAIFLAALALAVGVLLAWVGRPFARGRRWARSPIVVVQLLALPVGVGFVQGALYGYAVPDLALAIAVLALLVTPAARTPFEGGRKGPAKAPRPSRSGPTTGGR
jgi:peptidoglycan/LPS O-acetylase OafA/YrhL